MSVARTICSPGTNLALQSNSQVLDLWFLMNMDQERTYPHMFAFQMPNEFAGSGYLSSSYGPFGLGSDPAQEILKLASFIAKRNR